MGRPAKPSNVHLLNGNPSKKSAADLVGANVRMPVHVPPCPQHLSTEARTEYHRITPFLVRAGGVTDGDRAALAMYCEAWGEWVVLSKKIKEDLTLRSTAALIDSTPSGYKQISVMVQLRDRAADRMLRCAKEFGLTPASRIQSTSGQQMALPGVPDDPMESFLSAGSNLSLAS